MVQCAAKSKQTGEQCRRDAMHDRTVCYMHGGRTPRGFALPQTKTGRYSKDLPTRLASRYAESESDETLLSLRDDIRLSDALIQEKLSQLDTGESGEAWRLMKKSVDALSDAIVGEDYVKIQKALREMRDVIDMRVAHYAAEIEIRNGLEQRRKLVETEMKMTLAGEQAITAEKAMLFVGAIAGILKTRIHDSTILATIQNDISLLLDVREID